MKWNNLEVWLCDSVDPVTFQVENGRWARGDLEGLFAEQTVSGSLEKGGELSPGSRRTLSCQRLWGCTKFTFSSVAKKRSPTMVNLGQRCEGVTSSRMKGSYPVMKSGYEANGNYKLRVLVT